MPNALEQLRRLTTVVADTGDFESIRDYQPQDATTNPTLIYKAIQMDAYKPLLDQAVKNAQNKGKSGDDMLHAVVDELLVLFGKKILEIIPGRVSTEVDARLSYDTANTVKKAHDIIRLYESVGVNRKRILIKIASTWEGIRAAENLEKEGIHCNLTLLFSLPQAIACAEAGVTLISPFVGRIYDWYKKNEGRDFQGAEDPGVQSVQKIFNYYKHFGYKTEVMGASFRNVGQIIELAGCDLLTISPNLLQELKDMPPDVEQKLFAEQAQSMQIDKQHIDEAKFNELVNADPMAKEKLSDGIKAFSEDIDRLEAIINEKIKASV